jgi:pilus assembly protein CpaC
MQQLKRNGGVKMMRGQRSATLGIVSAVLAVCLVASAAPAYDGEGGAIVRLSSAVDDQQRLRSLDLEMGKSVFVQTDFTVKRVSVGSPKVLEVVVLSPKEVQLVPQQKGTTNLIFWSTRGDPAAVVDVSIGNSFTEIERKLRSILGSDDIHVEAVGEAIVLRGNVGGPILVERASAIARSFFPEGGEGKVVNSLEVGGNQQVMIEVIIAEMQRNLGRRLATNWSAAIRTGSRLMLFESLLGGLAGIDQRNVTMIPPGIVEELTFSDRIDLAGTFINNGSFAFNTFIQAATERGLAKVLAKPTLLARSGQSASFLAGGEVPIPVAQGGAFGSITIEFKQFGVGVEFAPTVLGDDRIYLEVSPEVSEPDFTIGTSTGGVFTPGFITRRASTSVELADGQSFAIAGLLSERVRQIVERVPVLGDIPILGALFRSQDFQRDETELVLIVTPRLVTPLTGELELPTDSFVEPEGWEFFLLGAMEKQCQGDSSDYEADTATLMGPAGYRLPVAMEEEVR